MTKAISAVIATIMLFMITVSLIGVFYVFSSTMATQSTSSGSAQASQLTSQLSMCMQVDNIIGNQVTLRNCGKGVIENKSLAVTMDDIALSASTQTIAEGNSSVVNISGLWQVPFGKHNLKITNGAAVAQSLVDVQPNPDGLAGSWNFDEGSGAKAYDGSGNGNVGTLNNMNTTGNATSGWAEGKFGSGLQFDGTNDYVDAGNGASLNITNAITISAWVFTNDTKALEFIGGHGNTANNGWIFYVSNGNSAGIQIGNGTALANSIKTYSIGTWAHVVGLYNGNQLITYVNGVAGTPTSFTGLINYGAITNTWIGQTQGSGGNSVRYFNGTIDEVRIWSRALAPDETVAMKQII